MESGRLLVVDDVEGNRYVHATWLRRAGYDVTEASTGQEALDHVSTGAFDLVLLDINLPDITGYEVCERIKGTPRTALLPVLHVSATATNLSDRTEGLRRGAEGYLCEPVEREELLATVGALLRASSAQQHSAYLAERLRALHDATLAINDASTLRALIEAVAHEASRLFDRRIVVAMQADFDSFVGVSDGAVTMSSSATSGGYIRRIYDSVAEMIDGRNDDLRAILPISASQTKTYSIARLPRTRDQIGMLLIESDGPPAPDADAVVLAQYLRVVASAIRNAGIHDTERHIALTLQRGLLPKSVPEIDGYEIAVRYEAGTEHAEIGGDFYEIFKAGDSRAIVAIGDVAGHSLEAASTMAQLRTAIRSYALEGHEPNAILERLNAMLQRFHAESTATVSCGWIDLKTGVCCLANAGHLPPLIVANGETRYLRFGEALLGVRGDAFTNYEFALEQGQTLLFYTDGLIERRGEPLDVGLERLRTLALQPFEELPDLCDRLIAMASDTNLIDDIAMMAIRRRPLSPG
jgi:CheY-like chemotaxis protein